MKQMMYILTKISMTSISGTVFNQVNVFKGTPLWSGCVTHLKRFFSKTCFFLLTCVEHSSLSCGTLICLLLVCNSFKTCIISVDLGKTLVMLFPVLQIRSNF